MVCFGIGCISLGGCQNGRKYCLRGIKDVCVQSLIPRCSSQVFFPPLCFQMFGCGAVAQLVLSRGSHGTFLSVNLAFGFAATLGVLVSGQVSGEDTLYCSNP